LVYSFTISSSPFDKQKCISYAMFTPDNALEFKKGREEIRLSKEKVKAKRNL